MKLFGKNKLSFLAIALVASVFTFTSCEEEDPGFCPICGEPLEDQLEELRFDD